MKANQKIPSGEGEAELIEKKSRFISHVFHITTVEEANEKLAELRKKYWDASHNCYAYILDSDNVMRFSDDGEPQGTAGMPILEVLKKQQIYCVLVVVTRYFGGILLGAGGLTRAYGKAATLGLENSGVSVLMPYYSVKIATPYNFFDQIRRTYEHFDVSETAVEYGADVTITAAMPKEKFEGFFKQLTELTSAAVSPEILEETLLPQKIS